MNLERGRRLGALGIGILATEGFNHFVDFLVFPLVIGFLGVWAGWPILLLICLLGNYINIIIYRKTGFGDVLMWLEQIRKGNHLGLWRKFLRFLFRFGHWPLVVALTIEDPAKGFVYARSRVLKERFNSSDVALFIGANILGSALWVFGWAGVLALARRAI